MKNLTLLTIILQLGFGPVAVAGVFSPSRHDKETFRVTSGDTDTPFIIIASTWNKSVHDVSKLFKKKATAWS